MKKLKNVLSWISCKIQGDFTLVNLGNHNFMN